MRARRTPPLRAAKRRGRSSACRSPTRTWCRPRAFARRSARRSIATTFPPSTASSSGVCARPAPIAITEAGETFRRPLDRDFRGVRIAWSRDLGGLPIDRRVTAALEPRRKIFETLGCVIEDTEPDVHDAREIFQALRALSFAIKFGPLLSEHRHQIKDTVIWNTEQGLKLTARELGEAEVKRTALYHRVRQFMERHEFLVLPVTQVPPFDVTQPYVTEIEGVRLPTYIDWMRACSDITVTGHPAISVPGGFTPEGLPVGLQIVGRHQDEWSVLQLAHAFEQATGVGRRRPSLGI